MDNSDSRKKIRLDLEDGGVIRRLTKPENAERDFRFALGFIGAGMMAESLVKGLLKSGFVANAQTIIVSDIDEARLQLLDSFGCVTTSKNSEVVENSRRIILAVKPQMVREVLQEVKAFVGKEQLLMSICAGITLETLEHSLRPGCHVIRVMPNTCTIVQAAASCFALGEHADDEDSRTCQSIFECVGLAFQIRESLLDAVTGLSGSGPAYVFMFIEAMSDGGVRMGIPRDVSMKLAAQTLFGSAKMVLEMGAHPAELKNKVESPGGTTIAGTAALEDGKFRAAVINAVTCATNRSHALGESNRNIK